MGHLTTHVLDTANGIPAAGVAGRLLGSDGNTLTAFVTNQDGRCDQPLLAGDSLKACLYTLIFETAAYFRGRGTPLADPPFLDEIVIKFAIADPTADLHVPLLVSPWSFSTYRGS